MLHRSKFHFKEETIQLVINAVKQYGMEVFPQPTGEILVDMDDLVFYEVAMEKRDDDAYLVTGNQKYYPIKVLFTFSLKDVRKLSEKVMNIIYLPEKSFDNEEKLDIIKVKNLISKL